MKNGTEKQIAWATEIKTNRIAGFMNTESASIGSDKMMLMIIGAAAKHGMGRNDRDQYRARCEAYSAITPDQLRAEIVARAAECDDAIWWIENRTTLGNEFAFPFLKTIHA